MTCSGPVAAVGASAIAATAATHNIRDSAVRRLSRRRFMQSSLFQRPAFRIRGSAPAWRGGRIRNARTAPAERHATVRDTAMRRASSGRQTAAPRGEWSRQEWSRHRWRIRSKAAPPRRRKPPLRAANRPRTNTVGRPAATEACRAGQVPSRTRRPRLRGGSIRECHRHSENRRQIGSGPLTARAHWHRRPLGLRFCRSCSTYCLPGWS